MLALNIFSIFSLFALPAARRGWFGLRDNSPGAGGRRAGSSNAPQDHLGSIRVLTDEDGGVTERTTWGPWGARLEGGERSRVGYTGHQTERESGLRYSVHRYLDPRNGRWTRRDPAGGIDGSNLYRYVANQPVRAIDPTGLLLFIHGGERQTLLNWLNEMIVGGLRFASNDQVKIDEGTIQGSGGTAYAVIDDILHDCSTEVHLYAERGLGAHFDGRSRKGPGHLGVDLADLLELRKANSVHGVSEPHMLRWDDVVVHFLAEQHAEAGGTAFNSAWEIGNAAALRYRSERGVYSAHRYTREQGAFYVVEFTEGSMSVATVFRIGPILRFFRVEK